MSRDGVGRRPRGAVRTTRGARRRAGRAARAVRAVASDRDVWRGVGIGVAGEAATFFVLDAFGSARAVDYEEHVKRFDPSLAFSIGDGARPSSLALGGQF